MLQLCFTYASVVLHLCFSSAAKVVRQMAEASKA